MRQLCTILLSIMAVFNVIAWEGWDTCPGSQDYDMVIERYDVFDDTEWEVEKLKDFGIWLQTKGGNLASFLAAIPGESLKLAAHACYQVSLRLAQEGEEKAPFVEKNRTTHIYKKLKKKRRARRG